jgi:cardiolipin synthase
MLRRVKLGIFVLLFALTLPPQTRASSSEKIVDCSQALSTATEAPKFGLRGSDIVFATKTLIRHPGIIRDAIAIAVLYSKKELKTENPELKKILLRLGARFQDSGQIEEVIRYILMRARDAGKLPKIYEKPEMFEKIILVTLQGLRGQLAINGASKEGANNHYEDWIRLSNRIYPEIHKIAQKIESVRSPEFRLAVENQAKTRFTTADRFDFLVDGPAAFAERLRLIKEARKSIHIMSWSFEDDETGEFYSNLLIQRFKEGIDVKIMVDEQTARRAGYHSMLDKMEAAGISVIRWSGSTPESRYTVMHKKVTLIDGFYAVGGGTNYADFYSHMGPAEKAKWRDTDAIVTGALAWDTQLLFARMWNEQVSYLKNPKLKKVDLSLFAHEMIHPPQAAQSPVQATLINHDPGRSESVLRTILLSIECARESVVIENAYFILYPALYKAIIRARLRGVRVVVLSNSFESLDEPIGPPIMKSVNRLIQYGVEVYLKKGFEQTLHSKIFVVDGFFGWIGSYNIHPRSHRYDSEMIWAFLSETQGRWLKEIIERDLHPDKAQRLSAPVPFKDDIQSEASWNLFYDEI